MPARTWSAEQRAAAIGLALSVGVREASRRSGVPRRSLSRWIASPAAMPIRQATDAELSARFRSIVAEGAESLLAGIRDPRSRLSDRSRAVEVAVGSMRLLHGQSTANVASLTGLDLTAVEMIGAMDAEQRRLLSEILDSLRRAEPAEAAETLAALRDPLAGELTPAAVRQAISVIERRLAQKEGRG